MSPQLDRGAAGGGQVAIAFERVPREPGGLVDTPARSTTKGGEDGVTDPGREAAGAMGPSGRAQDEYVLRDQCEMKIKTAGCPWMFFPSCLPPRDDRCNRLGLSACLLHRERMLMLTTPHVFADPTHFVAIPCQYSSGHRHSSGELAWRTSPTSTGR